MRPIFSIHAGEYLVALELEKRFKNCEMWFPSKDTGSDLLLVNNKKRKILPLQVKFSKNYDLKKDALIARGWWNLNRKKIKNSPAHYWIFILYSGLDKKEHYLIIKPTVLLKHLESIHGRKSKFNVYFWITKDSSCWETRDLKASEQKKIEEGVYKNSERNFTKYLNDWSSIKKRMK